ncbi:MAG: glycosyltransferase [Nitrosomonadales bacterium]|nr:glycosyltransferase [Nitrosomonadales bacterium]
MKISIAVPSFNYGRYLRDCLSSIRSQSYPDFEVLIADGGSSDESMAIIREYCDLDQRFRLVSSEDAGQADAVDKAFCEAQGDILCFLNADDVFLCDDVFETMVKTFTSYANVSIVSAEGYYLDAKGKYIKPVNLRYHPMDNMGWMKYRTAVLQPATFWRREVYKQIPFNKEFHYVFDAHFFYEAYLNFSWLSIPKAVAGYRLHEENKSVTVRPKRIFELAKLEQHKFGRFSLRAGYLFFIYVLVWLMSKIPLVGRPFTRVIYLLVNSLSFVCAYRLPGI